MVRCILKKIVMLSAQLAGTVVSASRLNYKEAKEYLVKHQTCNYHKLSATLKNFAYVSQNPETCISIILERDKTKNEGRQSKTFNIVKCIEFCSRHQLSLRGYRGTDF